MGWNLAESELLGGFHHSSSKKKLLQLEERGFVRIGERSTFSSSNSSNISFFPTIAITVTVARTKAEQLFHRIHGFLASDPWVLGMARAMLDVSVNIYVEDGLNHRRVEQHTG
jgi:hypothetical protein